MTDLVIKSQGGKPITTSLLVSEKFDKEHKHVLDSIREILAAENSATNFFHETEYENRGKKYPMFLMTRDGFTLLAMGFTGPKAMQFKIDFINAFNKMEAALKPQLPGTFAEALQLAADQAKQIELQESKLKEMTPKALFADSVATSDKSILVADLAKILKQNGIEIGQNRLYIWMRENGYLCSKGEYYNWPSQKAMGLGLFEIKETAINKPGGSILTTFTTKVTGKGQVYFVNKFLNAVEVKVT